MDDLEKELKVGFLDEAAQLLDDAEQCFLELESSSDDPSIIDKIFRLAHNLKGSGRAVGFAQMAEFTHELESLILKLKNKEMPVRTSTVNLLLRSSDHLKKWIETLRGDLDALVDSDSLISEIRDQIAGKIPDEAAPSTEAHIEEGQTPEASGFPEEPPAESHFQSGSADDLVAPALPYPGPEAFAALEAVASPEAPKVIPEIVQKAKPAETKMPEKQTSDKANEDESIRVSLKRLENLVNSVGELVILQTVLNQQRHLIPSNLIQRTVVQLAKITKDIQETSMSLRMIPLKQTFQKMQRIVRDTSKSLNKKVQLNLGGEETELDKTVVEQLGDPLVHLVRNAVDHGLETTEERLAAGKSEVGQVHLKAYHRGSKIVIEVGDDGKGLDPKKLISKAIEKGVIKPGAQLSDKEAYNLIFAPGFSTKAEVTEVSGRGVGMDVVKTNVEKNLNGEIYLETGLGKGTTIYIILPLTLAIIDGMVVTSNDERYIVPLNHVHESLQPSPDQIHQTTGLGEVLSLRGEQIPLFRLSSALGRTIKNPKPITECIAIVVRVSDRPFSVVVDDILGQQQIVIKKLGNEIGNLKGVSGGAILGDGKAALILDLNELASRLGDRGKNLKGAA